MNDIQKYDPDAVEIAEEEGEEEERYEPPHVAAQAFLDLSEDDRDIVIHQLAEDYLSMDEIGALVGHDAPMVRGFLKVTPIHLRVLQVRKAMDDGSGRIEMLAKRAMGDIIGHISRIAGGRRLKSNDPTPTYNERIRAAELMGKWAKADTRESSAIQVNIQTNLGTDR